TGHLLSLPGPPTAVAGAAACFVLRWAAIRRGWRLPVPRGDDPACGWMRRVTGLIPTRQAACAGSARDVFRTFLRLGLTSFGGPVAHVGYMRDACVVRRGWVDEARFAQLVALCQFLPGPASSQLGFALGLLRAGWRGGVAAFVAFT